MIRQKVLIKRNVLSTSTLAVKQQFLSVTFSGLNYSVISPLRHLLLISVSKSWDSSPSLRRISHKVSRSGTPVMLDNFTSSTINKDSESDNYRLSSFLISVGKCYGGWISMRECVAKKLTCTNNACSSYSVNR